MPRGRPPVPASVTKGHLTKEEREMRENAEAALASSAPLTKWPSTKRKKFASEHFDRIVAAYGEIGMNDTLYEAVLNRYCTLLGECEELERKIPAIKRRIRKTEKTWDERFREQMPEPKEIVEFTKAISLLEKQANGLEMTLASKRGALLAIEKENVMTVLAKLRAVPKKAPENDEDEDPMAAVLGNVTNIADRR